MTQRVWESGNVLSHEKCPARGSWAAAHGINTVLEAPLEAFFVGSMGRLKGDPTRLAPVGTGRTDPAPGLAGAFRRFCPVRQVLKNAPRGIGRIRQGHSHRSRRRGGQAQRVVRQVHNCPMTRGPMITPSSLHATRQRAAKHAPPTRRGPRPAPRTTLAAAIHIPQITPWSKPAGGIIAHKWTFVKYLF